MLGTVWVHVVVVDGCGESKNDLQGEGCFCGYGDDGDNGVNIVGVGGGCNGDGIAEGWDGGAVQLGDVGGIEGADGTRLEVLAWSGQRVQQGLGVEVLEWLGLDEL